MVGESLRAVEAALAAALEGEPGLPLQELTRRVGEALLGGAVAPELLLYLLRSRPARFRATADGAWTIVGVTPPPARGGVATLPRESRDASEDDNGRSRPIGEPGPLIPTAAGTDAATPPALEPDPLEAASGHRALTPSRAFEHVKESVVGYIEAAYKISHPLVHAERGAILRRRGAVAQAPFIEATPAFPTGRFLADLERERPEIATPGLAELVHHGVPVDRFALYEHQEAALLAAFGGRPNLLVASGTGSGKTEAFLLPILADVLREARGWPAPRGPARHGEYDERTGEWRHARRHEARPAALRAIVLYPMNALVNDQLARLRRILARPESEAWQRENLNGNVVHFGMYTGLTRPTGSPSDRWRREQWRRYLDAVSREWAQLRADLRETGGWPRPDGPEMLGRWDSQAAPPDILVTNYSMLEYMLVRPVEAAIFERTREWLRANPDARLTLVLDEAHTYTGAKGTEVAYLIRRLKERLGLGPGSAQFRAIATSASIPEAGGSDERLLRFAADLFGEQTGGFSVVRVRPLAPPPARAPGRAPFRAYQAFHESFDPRDPWPAIELLAEGLALGPVDRALEAPVALHGLLASSADVAWVRARTARNATLLDRLADECWPGQGTSEQRERATAGVLAAGSFARATPSADTPPLLSTRVHGFFRGVPGVWACLDPACDRVEPGYRGERPLGKLYTDPRPWCDCGARVLEVFSCRDCGLLFVGGIPDDARGSLWPWSDDLSGERPDPRALRIFGVESPAPAARPERRSILTTLPVHPGEPDARPVYEVEPVMELGRLVSPFPAKCPRCQHYRAPGDYGQNGREVVTPLKTRGPRAFSVIVEDGFRVQPRAARGGPPNHGRKALLFADSRQEAATLAADLRLDHANDLFRQLLYRVLRRAGGAVDFATLRRAVVEEQIRRRVDPTASDHPSFFARLDAGDPSCRPLAERYFDVGLRRELAEDDYGLEPLGLASWRVRLPERVDQLPALSNEETRLFLRSVARILATESVLLPPHPWGPFDWPAGAVKEHERVALVPGHRRDRSTIPYNLQNRRKLGRYAIAVSEALRRDGRLAGEPAQQNWLKEMHWALWVLLKSTGVLRPADGADDSAADGAPGADVPHGIRIDQFELWPVGAGVHRCETCRYLTSEALIAVCPRCGQATRPTPTAAIENFYRRAALHALPGSGFDDPYPLRAIEHTAQIPGVEARDLERWFQDFFRDDEHPDDRRVDVLSVTTTMEMGIDIGSLLCVGLRNVPPTVANYQQRAGRAGRRGSAVATVLTFAQPRSHDQYYFHRPPEIVSEPPRVPALYLRNDVIARRHVRSLVLQDFFRWHLRGRPTKGLMNAWGTIGEYLTRQAGPALAEYAARHRRELMARCRTVVDRSLAGELGRWIDEAPGEVQAIVDRTVRSGEDLFEGLIAAGLLPKYAFPVDVVGLAMPAPPRRPGSDEPEGDSAMQRDLRIALAEYAPGAEVIRGAFPRTYVYRSAGVYDPFASRPDYHPSGSLVECRDCQAIELEELADTGEPACRECGSLNVTRLPYLIPRGFTVDQARPNGGAEVYRGGGRERGGDVAPARLLAGQTSFTSGRRSAAAPRLYTHVRAGELFAANAGQDRLFPGFLICPVCGRALDKESPGSHTYPSDVPPHRGARRGPRAGDWCPNRADFDNQVVLGHRFHSEVVLLGADLPPELDASFVAPAGRAVWYSFGTLLQSAAAVTLQVDPTELRVGVRPARRPDGRVHGEVYVYDDVPGGAGYARAIEQSLPEILERALGLGRECANPECPGACYHCLYDYGNQRLHPLLDRELGAALLAYLLHGAPPALDPARTRRAGEALAAFARASWTVCPGVTIGGRHLPVVLEDALGQSVALWVVHPLEARPGAADTYPILAEHGHRVAVHTSFDLERRPFWVLNHLLT